MQQTERERRGNELERRLAGGESPRPRVAACRRACLRARNDQAVVGPRVRSRAKPEHAGPVAGHLEDVPGRRREFGAGSRRADTLQRVEPQESCDVERHAPGRRGLQRKAHWCAPTLAAVAAALPPEADSSPAVLGGPAALIRRIWVRAAPAHRPPSRRCRPTAAAGEARRRCAAVARSSHRAS